MIWDDLWLGPFKNPMEVQKLQNTCIEYPALQQMYAKDIATNTCN